MVFLRGKGKKQCDTINAVSTSTDVPSHGCHMRVPSEVNRKL
jgi:hypothetical protein